MQNIHLLRPTEGKIILQTVPLKSFIIRDTLGNCSKEIVLQFKIIQLDQFHLGRWEMLFRIPYSGTVICFLSSVLEEKKKFSRLWASHYSSRNNPFIFLTEGQMQECFNPMLYTLSIFLTEGQMQQHFNPVLHTLTSQRVSFVHIT